MLGFALGIATTLLIAVLMYVSYKIGKLNTGSTTEPQDEDMIKLREEQERVTKGMNKVLNYSEEVARNYYAKG